MKTRLIGRKEDCAALCMAWCFFRVQYPAQLTQTNLEGAPYNSSFNGVIKYTSTGCGHTMTTCQTFRSQQLQKTFIRTNTNTIITILHITSKWAVSTLCTYGTWSRLAETLVPSTYTWTSSHSAGCLNLQAISLVWIKGSRELFFCCMCCSTCKDCFSRTTKKFWI